MKGDQTSNTIIQNKECLLRDKKLPKSNCLQTCMAVLLCCLFKKQFEEGKLVVGKFITSPFLFLSEDV